VISLHVSSNISSLTAANASLILVFKMSMPETGVEYTLSLAYPHKEKSRGIMPGERGGHGIGSSLPIYRLGNVASKN
jgi:hypothetical protein